MIFRSKSAQTSVSCSPWRIRRSAVHNLRCSTSHKKNFTCGSAFTRQTSLAPGSDAAPTKKARYANDAEYLPSGDHFQTKRSDANGSSSTLLNSRQTRRYRQSTCVVSAPTISCAQRRWNKPSFTILRFPTLEMAAKSSGAKKHSGPTGAQQSVHSFAELPSPRTTDMLTALIAATCFSDLEGSSVQPRSGSDLANHSQCRRRARPKKRRSRMPNPPRDVGLHTIV